MSLPRREGSRIGFVEKFSSYLEVSVVNMFKDQGRCPGLKKMKQTFFYMLHSTLTIPIVPIHLIFGNIKYKTAMKSYVTNANFI